MAFRFIEFRLEAERKPLEGIYFKDLTLAVCAAMRAGDV